MIEVELPNGDIAEFPDGTSPDVIKRVLGQQFRQDPIPAPVEMAPAAKPAPKTLQEAGQRVFGFDPGLDRATLLPLARNPQGGLEFATPGIVKNILESALLPGHVVGGGQYTPEDVTNLALDIAVPMTARANPAGPISRGLSRSELIEAAPSTEDIRKASTRAKDRAVASGVRISPDRNLELAASVESLAKGNRVNPVLHPKSSAVLDELAKTVGDAPDIEDLYVTRRIVNEAAGSPVRDDRRIGRAMVEKIDEFIDRLGPDDVIGGDPTDVGKNINQFKTLWSRSAKSEVIEEIVRNAEVAAAGFEAGLRAGFRNLYKNEKKMRPFSTGERQLIKDAAQGKGGNVARVLGKFGVSSHGGNVLGASMAGAGGYALGGPLGMVAAPMATSGLRRLAGSAAFKNAQTARAAAATGLLPDKTTVLGRALTRSLEKATTPLLASDRDWPPGFI